MPSRFFVIGIVMSQVELLAPAGSYESAFAALNAGADALYVGGKLFSARANAENFTQDQLIEVMDYAHLHEKKIYLTINTLLKDNEIQHELFSFLEPLYCAGLDAVIVQDFGVMQFVKEHFPNLHIHVSTQMTVFGKETVKALEEFGVSRVVLPREFSLDEISDIRKNSTLEIETFVHGALCYCYSGQCLMSSFIGGRSGNRGRCAQPCRMEYNYFEKKTKVNDTNQTYLLSPKDICAIKILPQILAAGVNSLKIEGRMKKAEYVAGVVHIYRKYLDLYQNQPKEYHVCERDLQNLADLFQRNGFHESYYNQHHEKNMISLYKPQFRIENKELNEFLRREYIGIKRKVPLNISVTCVAGKPFQIETEIAGKTICVTGQNPSPAKNTPLSEETLRRHIGKLGNTFFSICKMTCDFEEGLFLPVSAIKDLRRALIQQVETEMLSKFRRTDMVRDDKAFVNQMKTAAHDNQKKLRIHCLVWNMQQFSIIIKQPDIQRVYLETVQFSSQELKQCITLAHKKRKEIYLAMPYVFRKDDAKRFSEKSAAVLSQIDGALIRNIEQYYYFKKNQVAFHCIFDYNVYTMNQYAKQFLQDMKADTTAPLELNHHELKELGVSDMELIIYGYIPVMVSANCVKNTFGRCDHDNRMIALKDQKNNLFSVQCVCEYCYNLMLNCHPLSLLKYSDMIHKLHPASLRLIFSQESEQQIEKILGCVRRAFLANETVEDEAYSTRGHFMRGVQ